MMSLRVIDSSFGSIRKCPFSSIVAPREPRARLVFILSVESFPAYKYVCGIIVAAALSRFPRRMAKIASAAILTRNRATNPSVRSPFWPRGARGGDEEQVHSGRHGPILRRVRRVPECRRGVHDVRDEARARRERDDGPGADERRAPDQR